MKTNTLLEFQINIYMKALADAYVNERPLTTLANRPIDKAKKKQLVFSAFVKVYVLNLKC